VVSAEAEEEEEEDVAPAIVKSNRNNVSNTTTKVEGEVPVAAAPIAAVCRHRR
jgi:hypothetical protein